jgi:outer membrane protein OmpA-like peptidoglycan-associated protein
MNSKTLVYLVFLLWAAICWRWYVCGVKQACKPTTNVATVQDITPAIEEDTAAVAYIPPEGSENVYNKNNSNAAANNSIKQNTSGSGGGTGAPAKSGSTVTDAIDVAQVEDLIDKMVIYFPYNSTRKVDDEAIDDYLSQLANRLIASGGIATITGHTDFVGDAAANKTFGMQRAVGIRNILIKKGVPKDKIKVRSFGDTKPVATNDTPRGRYLNRRVEITYKD